MLQTVNLGRIDQIVRACAGLTCLVLYFGDNSGWSWLWLGGIYFLVTASMASDPLYKLFGLSTRRRALHPD